MIDVVIVGGGPAGLSAALLLGRCLRSVVVIDAGRRRNQRARFMNGYLTRDGIAPAEFLGLARDELSRYGVEFIRDEAICAERRDAGFRIVLASGRTLESRKLLLGTGVVDLLPPITGLDPLYGTSVHHCPYCDAWQHRGQRLAAYGKGDAALGLALSLRTWSPRVTACTDGEAPTGEKAARAAAADIPVRPEPVVSLEGDQGQLRRIHFASGEPLECDALFFNTGQVQRSALPGMLGCGFREDGGVRTNDRQCTGVPGLYVAGDADKDVQFVIVAAAEGATAGVAINRELQEEDRSRA